MFLINVPIVLMVVSLAARFVPAQQGRPEQPLNISHAIMLIVAILLLVYSAKTALKGAVAVDGDHYAAYRGGDAVYLRPYPAARAYR